MSASFYPFDCSWCLLISVDCSSRFPRTLSFVVYSRLPLSRTEYLHKLADLFFTFVLYIHPLLYFIFFRCERRLVVLDTFVLFPVSFGMIVCGRCPSFGMEGFSFLWMKVPCSDVNPATPWSFRLRDQTRRHFLFLVYYLFVID